jgi:predicted ATPase
VLTRLKVNGFKNLVDVDIWFGPFTCVAGPNAVGKSNMFDAIRFLSYLANNTLMDAALSVRSEGAKTADIRNLFHRVGDEYAQTMQFEADMILPKIGTDDLGQKAEATITFVRYRIEIGYRLDETLPTLGSLELLQEKLEHINLGNAPRLLKFGHKPRAWHNSVLTGRRTSPFISTIIEDGNPIIKLSQDKTGGRPRSFLAKNLPRTVLSTVNAMESPTVLIARREMQSWRLLQLEPSAMREPDSFTTPPGLGVNGAHLATTLYYLSRKQLQNNDQSDLKSRVFDRIAARLSELIDDVREVSVDRDQKRELLTLVIREKDGTIHPARSLSDGTLRFLALTVLDLDPHSTGLICLEEPENGIHPQRIPAMIRLLQDIACDVESPVGPDNPLRQVIVNTHSPAVVSQIPDESLLVAESKQMLKNKVRFNVVQFSWLPETWRSKAEPSVKPVARGKVLAYLNPIRESCITRVFGQPVDQKVPRRVMDRKDLQLSLPLVELNK